jgi:hypothetical protein
MTRLEKLRVTFDNMKKEEELPRPNPSVQSFILRRKQNALQLRYWARIGHELPKIRKISGPRIPG